MWSVFLLSALAFDAPDVQLATGCVATVAELGTAFDERMNAGAVIVVRKEARKAMVFSDGVLVSGANGAACWDVGLGYGYPEGHKVVMGDMRTPEGWYRVSDRPWSRYHGALTVHYPDTEDADAGLADGRITKAQRDAIARADRAGTLPPMQTRLGGQILLHGGGGSADWTLGCVGLDNDHIDRMRGLMAKDKRGWVLILP